MFKYLFISLMSLGFVACSSDGGSSCHPNATASTGLDSVTYGVTTSGNKLIVPKNGQESKSQWGLFKLDSGEEAPFTPSDDKDTQDDGDTIIDFSTNQIVYTDKVTTFKPNPSKGTNWYSIDSHEIRAEIENELKQNSSSEDVKVCGIESVDANLEAALNSNSAHLNFIMKARIQLSERVVNAIKKRQAF